MSKTILHLNAIEIQRIHDRSIKQYGGLAGMENPDRISSLLCRVLNYALYENVNDVYALAAMYCVAIARGHIFFDGNKRTAINATLLFCRRNGVWLLPSPDLEEEVVSVATGAVSAKELAQFLKNAPQKHITDLQNCGDSHFP